MVILECHNSKVWKLGFDHPKRCGRSGGPWETRFRGEIPEFKVCKELGIKIVDGLGEKIRSSSDLTGIKEIK